MCWAKEVEDNLDRVEGLKRNLHEQSVPVAHRSIPEARQLKSLELAALIALRADESSILVNILQEIEAITLVIMQTANDVYRIDTEFMWRRSPNWPMRLRSSSPTQ